jgi:hypothetical protein
MTSQMTTIKMTDRSVIATCPLGMSMSGPGLSLSTSALLPVIPVLRRIERPTMAPAVAAAKAQAQAYAFAAAANGAGAGTAEGANGHAIGQHQKTTQHGKWAFRGLEPWSDPA